MIIGSLVMTLCVVNIGYDFVSGDYRIFGDDFVCGGYWVFCDDCVCWLLGI